MRFLRFHFQKPVQLSQLLQISFLLFSLNNITGCTDATGFSTTSPSLLSNALFSSSSSGTSPAPYMGVNVSSIGDYSPEVFADAMMSVRQWGDVTSPWLPSTTLQYDAQGWPMGDTGACVITGSDLLEVGTYKLSFTGQATVTNIADNNVSIANSVYNAATNTTTADVVVKSGAIQVMLRFQNTKRLPTDVAGTGFTNAKLIRPGQDGLYFSKYFMDRIQVVSTMRFMDLLATNGNLGVTWAGRRKPNDAVQKPLNGLGLAWENVIKIANATNKDIWVNIPEYATDDYINNLAMLFKYGSDASGNVYTSAQSNPVNPPLTSTGKLYLEYSNELWNFGFTQATHNTNRANAPAWVSGKSYAQYDYVLNAGNLYICTQAISSSSAAPTSTSQSIADGSGTWTYVTPFPTHLNYDNGNNIWYNGYRFTADRTMVISNIFRARFGDAVMGTKILPVLASQFVQAAIYRSGLQYINAVYGPSNTYGNTGHPVNYYIAAVAGAPYYGIPSLSNSVWNCTDLTTCTSYSATSSYNPGSYVTSNGKLYQVVSAVSAGWQSGKTYNAGNTVLSNGNLYKCVTSLTATTAPSGTGSSIADGSGTWSYVKTVSAHVAPTGTGSSIADGDGSWKYLYTYGDTAAETTQAFVDLNASIDSFVNGPMAAMHMLAITAAEYQIQPVAYEGGLDTSLDQNFVDLVTGDAFQNDARMGTTQNHFYNMWFAAGGKLVNYFSLAGGYSKWGTWGLTPDLKNPETTRMEAFIAEATMGVMPATTGWKSLPTTLLTTDSYSNGKLIVSGTKFQAYGASAFAYYEIGVTTSGSYTVQTNVTGSPLQISIDGVSVGQLAVGTGSKTTFSVSPGIHILWVTPVVSTSVNYTFDTLTITKN